MKNNSEYFSDLTVNTYTYNINILCTVHVPKHYKY